jgi:hypothetical protein
MLVEQIVFGQKMWNGFENKTHILQKAIISTPGTNIITLFSEFTTVFSKIAIVLNEVRQNLALIWPKMFYNINSLSQDYQTLGHNLDLLKSVRFLAR